MFCYKRKKLNHCKFQIHFKFWFSQRNVLPSDLTKENRIYIRGEFTRKNCKTAILLYCFHTAGVLHIFMLYNLLGPAISFYRKSQINIKRKPNYEIDLFHNWPMIISHRLYAFHLTNDDFPYNYKSSDVFIHLIHYKVYWRV